MIILLLILSILCTIIFKKLEEKQSELFDYETPWCFPLVLSKISIGICIYFAIVFGILAGLDELLDEKIVMFAKWFVYFGK